MVDIPSGKTQSELSRWSVKKFTWLRRKNEKSKQTQHKQQSIAKYVKPGRFWNSNKICASCFYFLTYHDWFNHFYQLSRDLITLAKIHKFKHKHQSGKKLNKEVNTRKQSQVYLYRPKLSFYTRMSWFSDVRKILHDFRVI